MTTATATARPLRRPDHEPVRRLEVVPTRAQRRARPRLLPAVITVGGIAAILLGQLLLSLALADGAYTIAGLQADQRDLLREQEALAEQLEIASSTQALTTRAEQLGMVASGAPVFLDVSTGAISGSPSAAGGSLVGSGQLIGNVLVGELAPLDAPIDPADPTVPPGAPTADAPAADPGMLPSPTTR